MILAGQFAGEEDVQRFYSEAEAAAQLDHPGIVPIFEIGESDGQHYFSMGFVEGSSLAERINDCPLPPGQAAEIVRDPFYGRGDPEGLNSSAIRRQHCVTDLENGQLRLTIDQGGSEYRRDFPGYFPPNARVVFEDHNYNPDKDGNANNRYTWHWDNLTIT